MSSQITNYPNQQVEYNGKTYSVEKTQNGVVVLVDKNGIKIYVTSNQLKNSSLFSFNQSMLEQNEEMRKKITTRVENYFKNDKYCTSEIKNLKEQREKYYAEFGTRNVTKFNDEQKNTFNNLEDAISALNFKHISFRNGIYSGFQDLFKLALNDAKWA